MTLLIEQVFRVVAASIVGAAIGYERENKNKPAGFSPSPGLRRKLPDRHSPTKRR